nr:hypothetical protein [Tanacetum cinerariifolium]
MSSLESAPTFAELFETNELKAQIQEKDTVILKLKEKIKSSSADDKERKVECKVEDIETQNLELDHRVTKLTAENNHLKQTYKQLFDSIKSSRVHSEEQCDDLINKVNLKSVEVADLNASLQERVLVRCTLKITKSEKPSVDTSTSPNIDYNTPVLSSTRVALVSSASGSKSKDNTKKNRIRRTLKKAKETELEDHSRKVKSSLNKASVVDSRASSSVITSVSNVNSNLKCASCNECLFSDNHDKCVVEYINYVNASRKSTSAKKQLIGRIATATIVPPREAIPIVQRTDKPVVTLVYTRKPRAKNVPNKMEPNKSWGSSSNVSTSITNCRLSKSSFGMVKFGNDYVAKIMGYGNYQIRNVMISRVYYVEGLGHNLFYVGQFCDSDLEVAFRQHTCFIRNLEGVDLLTGSQGNNLYTLDCIFVGVRDLLGDGAS